MSDWKAHALASLEEARRDIEAETEPTIIVICAIGVVDLANERPLSVYANQSWRWLRQMFAYATWRFSMKAEDELEALRKECATPRRSRRYLWEGRVGWKGLFSPSE